ncbi:ectopic P granules protein 5 homolog [Clytia hemisphaerica]|uniref:ectopic P granules protein 5 homolog n=1 Tax=Clytia hemisphaerica TaxID=252671 RepID=UPI0034D68CB9
MAECVRERPKAKKKKATNIQKNESKVTPKTGGSQPENSIVLQDTEIASTTEKVEIKNKENGSENKANSEPVASLDTSKNVTRIEDKQEIASSEGENENKEINKTETEEGEAGLLNTESVAVQSSLLPATDFHSELPEENDDNLTKNEPESVEGSAPFPSLEVTQEDDSLEQAVNPSTIISPYAESTAPPPSLEPVELQITGAIATAPPPSIELKSENTLVQDDIVMPQSVRPRSQVMTSRESLQQPLVEPIIETMEAFSEYQMKHFYHNQELEQIDFFVDEFLKNSQKEQHEFFELIQFYYKSRRRLGEILDKVEGLQSELKKKKDDAWVIKQNVYKAEGTCSCGVKVSQQQKYQQAFFQEEVKKSMSSELYTIRGIAHETLPLELYNSQVARLRIINYLTKFFHSSPELFNLTEELPISAKLPSNVDNNAIQVLLQLQECISILFHFKRYGVLEVTFSDDLHSWLDLLVAALHRIGTLPDSFFLLNHLLRCPPSTVAKISNYLQFPSFKTYSLVNKWNSPLVHHFMVMLATLTLPVKSRQEFLRKFEATILKKEEEKTVMVGRSISWTLVDEEKEEDEKLEDSWSLMTESDLIAVFDQYPFTELLAYLLDMEQNDEGKFRYSPSRTSSYDVISLFAFSSNLITLLSKIFDTYNLLRYRQFLKCVSRIIRLVTQVVSDHWLSYRNYRIDIIGDSTETIPTSQHPTQSQFNLKRLQMQFDQLFLTAAKHILSSHSAGAIQFLSTMPFEAIQSKSMWAVLFLAVDHKPDLATIIKYAGPENVPSVKELDISPNEGIFLLTALSNMAISRNGIEDRELIEAIANLIIEIAFLNRSLKTLYSKNGKDFLDTICTKHSFVVTSLLKYVDQEIEHMRDVMVYIFQLLPLSHWCPTIHDLEKIRTWLLHKAVTSEENQTARILLSNLNYQLTEMEDKLFLPRCYHHLIAIMIVEGYGVSFPDYPGGIQKLGNKDAGFISQVSKYAVSSFTKLMQSKTHAEYLAWGWDVLLKLKLHESEVTGLDLEQNLEDFLKAVSSQNHSNKTGWCITTLNALWNKKSFEFQIEETPSLINVNIALKSNGLFANYVAFSMTKDSHFVDLLLSKGIRYMTTLKDWYQYEAVMHMICNIVPLFLSCPERLFVDSFMQILNKLIHVDVDKAGYTDKIWQYFIAGTYSQKLSALVTAQIMQGQKHSVGKAQRYLSFWIFLFLKLPRWSRDCGVLFQIDQLCKTAFSVANGFTIIEDTLYDEYKALIKSNESRGMLSSMMGWLSANQLSPNPTGDFCYYAFASLRVEKRYEEEIGITNEIAKKLVSNSSMTVEEAFKKCKGSIKARYVPPMPSLTIYRWAEQAMVTPKDHPFLSIIWQQFFLLFLRKPTQESGIPSRTGVGMRFFQSPTLSSLLKDMKNSLRATASYHQEKSTLGESGDESNNKTPAKEHQYAKEFHELLSGLFQGFALWLEESRLHDPNLYLDSLPDAYMPDLLMKIFQGNQVSNPTQ